MLPVPFDRPNTQPLQYPLNSPPFVPDVQIVPEAEPLLVAMCAIVANEAAAVSSQSLPRMFCFNILSSNGWANTSFAEVVATACNRSVMMARQGMANSPGEAMRSAAAEVLVLYASHLVMSFSELAQMLPPEIVNSAAQNASVYQETLAAVASMLAQNQAYPMVQQRMLGRSAAPPLVMGRNRTNPTHPVTNSAAKSLYVPTSVEPTRLGALPARVPAGKTSPPAQAPAAPQQAPVDSSSLIGEIESMNRDQHSIVYFGQKHPMPTSPLRRKLEEAAETYEEIAKNNIDLAVPVIEQKWLAERSLDELIATVRVRRAEMEDQSLAVYVNYGMVVTPIISPLDTKETFLLLSKAGTFAAVAETLANAIIKVTDKAQLRQTLSYVSQIDRILTKLLNDFLMYQLEKNMDVDSFIEDAPKLTGYLNEKYKGQVNNLYTGYQTRVLQHLFKHTLAENPSNDMIAQLNEYSDSETPVWDNMVVSYSVTFINATSQELGYNVSKKPRNLTASQAPMLHRLMSAIQKVHTRTVVPTHHLIVTSDDARWAVYNVGNDPANFVVKEA